MYLKSPGESYHAQNLPHIRAAGKTYHVRFSVAGEALRLSEDWAFAIVEEAVLFRHKRQAILHGYVIMPSHVHVVMQPLPKKGRSQISADLEDYYPLETAVGAIKTHTSLQINARLGRRGTLWLDEYFDRIIRGGKDLVSVIDYIHHNPVRWGLVQRPEEYRWSSISTIYSGRSEYAAWFDLRDVLG